MYVVFWYVCVQLRNMIKCIVFIVDLYQDYIKDIYVLYVFVLICNLIELYLKRGIVLDCIDVGDYTDYLLYRIRIFRLIVIIELEYLD